MVNENNSLLENLVSELKCCLVEKRNSSFILASSRCISNAGCSLLKINKNLKDKGDFVVSFQHVECPKHVFCSEKISSPPPEEDREVEEVGESERQLVTKRLVRESNSWPIQIKECLWNDGSIIIKLNREGVFRVILNSLHTEDLDYGSQQTHKEVISIETDSMPENYDLSQHRLALAKQVVTRILEKLCYTVATDENRRECCLRLCLTLNPSLRLTKTHAYVCGVVRNSNSHKKEVNMDERSYRRMREKDMEQASVHKYGSSVLQPSWKEFISSLANAAVTVDLLCTRLSQPVSLDLQEKFILNRERSSKGAPFILYNYARLVSILKQFEEKVIQGVYPPLVPISAVDFSLLTSEEEWMLLFNFVLPYPSLLVQLVNPKDLKFDIHVLIHFMQDLCKCLSTYYSRMHILMEPRKHLLPLMYARIHLISGIKTLMMGIFMLFNIVPVSQM